ncbi:MAG TPA: hypothetical protein VHI78_06305 [Bacteroidales bacterium]|jgi:hypothetical protein|nr:hypothetical protein [Bacteroidales bacterium]
MKTKALIFLLPGIVFNCCKEDDDDRIPDENYNPVIAPANFSDEITNPYFPMVPGSVLSYRANTDEGVEDVVITVLSEKKTVAGVECSIVRDVVSLNGQVIEDTYDWFAQDLQGNVWYFGEDVSNYENGVLQDKEGSFEAGVDNAKPGIIMLAFPVLELPYRQEYSFGVAEDWGKVVAVNQSVTTPAGTFSECIKTADWNALEPDAPLEYKYYAPDIGMVKEEVDGTDEVLELISIEN